MVRKKDLVREDLDRAKLELEGEDDFVESDSGNFRFKRLKIVLLASFMVLLLLSFIYLSSPVYSFILGLAGSSKLVGSSVVFEDSVVVSFDDETLNFLQELYNPLGDEQAVCLQGVVEGDVYVITGYYVPLIFDNAWNFVSHASCSDDAVIMLHTHPFNRCEPSSTDRASLANSKLSNDESLMLVMCGKNRFSAVI